MSSNLVKQINVRYYKTLSCYVPQHSPCIVYTLHPNICLYWQTLQHKQDNKMVHFSTFLNTSSNSLSKVSSWPGIDTNSSFNEPSVCAMSDKVALDWVIVALVSVITGGKDASFRKHITVQLCRYSLKMSFFMFSSSKVAPWHGSQSTKKPNVFSPTCLAVCLCVSEGLD